MPIKPDGTGKWQVALTERSTESAPNYKRSLTAIDCPEYQAAKAFRRAKPFPSNLSLIGVPSSQFAHFDRPTSSRIWSYGALQKESAIICGEGCRSG